MCVYPLNIHLSFYLISWIPSDPFRNNYIVDQYIFVVVVTDGKKNEIE